MRLLAALIILAAIPAIAAAAEKQKPVVIPEGDTVVGRCVGVHDGDSMTLLVDTPDGPRQSKIRMDAIDAPELGQPFGTVARDRLAATERDARVARSGLWADKAPVPPWEWARGKRHRGEAAAPTGVRGGLVGAVSQAPTPQGLRKPLRKNDIFFGAATVRRACSRCLLETNNVKH